MKLVAPAWRGFCLADFGGQKPSWRCMSARRSARANVIRYAQRRASNKLSKRLEMQGNVLRLYP
jgi:hypothetical protein